MSALTATRLTCCYWSGIYHSAPGVANRAANACNSRATLDGRRCFAELRVRIAHMHFIWLCRVLCYGLSLRARHAQRCTRSSVRPLARQTTLLSRDTRQLFVVYENYYSHCLCVCIVGARLPPVPNPAPPTRCIRASNITRRARGHPPFRGTTASAISICFASVTTGQCYKYPETIRRLWLARVLVAVLVVNRWPASRCTVENETKSNVVAWRRLAHPHVYRRLNYLFTGADVCGVPATIFSCGNVLHRCSGTNSEMCHTICK